MFTKRTKKWVLVLVGMLALVLLSGAGVAAAAKLRHGPTSLSPVSTQAVQTGQEQELVGIVQSVDPAKQTFTLLLAHQNKVVTIAYDAQTNIHNDHRALQLTVGMHVVAQIMTRSDGSLYATEIEPVAAHWNGIPTSVQQDVSPAGTCDGTGPHGPVVP